MKQHIAVKNWTEFQHYKDRNPPWIKLHRTLLDNREWNLLTGDAAKVLVELWLIVSVDGTEGTIPMDVRDLSWRMRRSEKELYDLLAELRDHDFIGYTDEVPEGEEWPSRYIPKAAREAVWARDGGKCTACDAVNDIEYDHVVPVSQGGESTVENLQLLCRPCNRRKRVRSTRYADRSTRSEVPEPAYTETEGETEGETDTTSNEVDGGAVVCEYEVIDAGEDEPVTGTGVQVIPLHRPNALASELDLPFANKDPGDAVTAGDVMAAWITRKRPSLSKADRGRQAAAAARLVEGRTAWEVMLAMIGIECLWPFAPPTMVKGSEGRLWDLMDLEKHFPQAMDAAKKHPDLKRLRFDAELEQALAAGSVFR